MCSLKAIVYKGGVLEGIIEDYSYDAFKGSLVIYLDELFGVKEVVSWRLVVNGINK